MGDRERCDKRGALAGSAPGSDAAAVMENNFAGDGEPHSGSLVFVTGVQPLEDIENAVQIFFIEANAIVADRQFAQILVGSVRRRLRQNTGKNFRFDFDDGRDVRTAKFKGVTQEILE